MRPTGFQVWVEVFFITVFVAVSAESVVGQHILGTYPEGGGPISLTVTNDDAKMAGLDFVSYPNGDLVPVPVLPGELGADPFAFFLSNTPNQVTYGNLGRTTLFEAGTTTQLSVGVGPNADVGAAWGRGPSPVQIPLAPLTPGESALIGSFPSQGGPISLTAIGRDFALTGIDFQSPSEALAPFENSDPAPFLFFLSNTPNQVALGTLGTTATILENTTTTLPVGISPGASDVQAFFNEVLPDGQFEWAQPVQVVSSNYPGGLAPIIERTNLPPTTPPTGIEPPAVDPPVVQPPVVEPPVIEPPVVGSNALIGTFPEDGGPISIVALETVEVAGFDFQSNGGLIPAEGTDASPFTFFLSNTPDQVTYGNLGTTVTFEEGTTTELSVGVVAGTEDVQAFFGDGPTPVAFSIEPVLDNEDNLLGGGGMNPVEPPGPEMPNAGGGMQNPSTVPEPSSLLVWVTLGIVCVFQRWRVSLRLVAPRSSNELQSPIQV